MRQRWEIEEDENEERRQIRVRPGRLQSLVGGIVAVAMGLFAIFMFARIGGVTGGGPLGGGFSVFPLLFLLVVIALAGLSFYNAFSRKGVATYEIDIEREREPGTGAYCPNCGKPVGEKDRFCRHCGHQLEDV